jgi:hypothetical protein
MSTDALQGFLTIGGTVAGWVLAEGSAALRGGRDRKRADDEADRRRILGLASAAMEIRSATEALMQAELRKSRYAANADDEQLGRAVADGNAAWLRLGALDLECQVLGPARLAPLARAVKDAASAQMQRVRTVEAIRDLAKRASAAEDDKGRKAQRIVGNQSRRGIRLKPNIKPC